MSTPGLRSRYYRGNPCPQRSKYSPALFTIRSRGSSCSALARSAICSAAVTSSPRMLTSGCSDTSAWKSTAASGSRQVDEDAPPTHSASTDPLKPESAIASGDQRRCHSGNLFLCFNPQAEKNARPGAVRCWWNVTSRWTGRPVRGTHLRCPRSSGAAGRGSMEGAPRASCDTPVSKGRSPPGRRLRRDRGSA